MLRSIVACLSPEAIGRSIEIGHYSLFLSSLLAVASLIIDLLRRRISWQFVSMCTLSALHPAWTIGVYGGECGYVRRFFSVVVVVVLTAMLLCQLLRLPIRAAHFYLALSGLIWFAYSLTQLFHHVDEGVLFGQYVASAIVGSESFQALMLASRPLRDVAVVLTGCTALLLFAQRQRRKSNQALQPTAGRSDV